MTIVSAVLIAGVEKPVEEKVPVVWKGMMLLLGAAAAALYRLTLTTISLSTLYMTVTEALVAKYRSSRNGTYAVSTVTV